LPFLKVGVKLKFNKLMQISVSETPYFHPQTKATCYMQQQTKWSQFSVLITVFFFWGFVAASNDILIPVFKEKLHLEQWQSQMISFAFYVAYTVGSIIYLLVSKAIGGDILNRIGYKNGIAL